MADKYSVIISYSNVVSRFLIDNNSTSGPCKNFNCYAVKKKNYF